MESKVLKNIYDSLSDDGGLLEVMPNATGIWEEDKHLFLLIQEGMDQALEGKDNIDTMALFASDYDEDEEDHFWEDDM